MADYHDALIFTMRLVAAADGEVAEVEINVVDSLNETERGEGGIGSTGE